MDTLTFFKCLADDTRLKCVLLIALNQELCVCQLVDALKLSQPKISRHLAQLRECGLLTSERRQQWMFYSLSEQLPDWALKSIRLAANSSEKELLELNKMIQKSPLNIC